MSRSKLARLAVIATATAILCAGLDWIGTPHWMIYTFIVLASIFYAQTFPIW